MVIARIVEGNLQILSRHKEKVRLAAGLEDDLRLNQEAFERGLASLARFNERLQPFEGTSVRIVATHTLRRAINAKDFLEQAEKVLSHSVEVISGYEEARLIFQAVAHNEVTKHNTLVIDIGGGSTELAIGSQFVEHALASRSMGCVSFTQKYFAKGITKQAFKKAVIAAKQELEPITKGFKKVGWKQVRATSGTASALAECAKEFGYDAISKGSLQDLQKRLIENDGRLELAGISPDRMQVIAGGLAVMLAIVNTFEIAAIDYSPAALREGVLYEMHGGLEHDNVRVRSRDSLQKRYNVDLHQAKSVNDAANWLWHQLADDWQLSAASLKLLGFAAQLHEVGFDINSSAIQRHSAYIIEHTNMAGFNRDEQLVLANLVRFHRKRLQLNNILPIEKLMKDKTLIRLIRILRVAVLLNIGRHGYELPISAKAEGKVMTLVFDADTLEQQQLLAADLERESSLISAAGFELKIVAET
nr:exopolyphosphatase [Echinimonas agarilytica]